MEAGNRRGTAETGARVSFTVGAGDKEPGCWMWVASTAEQMREAVLVQGAPGSMGGRRTHRSEGAYKAGDVSSLHRC